jgi:hypothetical protein
MYPDKRFYERMIQATADAKRIKNTLVKLQRDTHLTPTTDNKIVKIIDEMIELQAFLTTNVYIAGNPSNYTKKNENE